ncbi:hypothetical protein PR048_008881 [Dryococelus australis]|uniref:Uncharacterized protein n=1 Tax=Dryococelus australis TaxID=614101 RepID=A0ABQ9HYB9_9NEOP|nr:hypothetical protein PR048_008881 [Dryococelus australis]
MADQRAIPLGSDEEINYGGHISAPGWRPPNYVDGGNVIFLYRNLRPRWLSDYHARILPRRTGFNLRVPLFASGNSPGRCYWSAGFLGDLPFPPSLHSELLNKQQAASRIPAFCSRLLCARVRDNAARYQLPLVKAESQGLRSSRRPVLMTPETRIHCCGDRDSLLWRPGFMIPETGIHDSGDRDSWLWRLRFMTPETGIHGSRDQDS